MTDLPAHFETDEISCACGFIGEGEEARDQLHQHIADNPFEFPVQRRLRELEAENERLHARLAAEIEECERRGALMIRRHKEIQLLRQTIRIATESARPPQSSP